MTGKTKVDSVLDKAEKPDDDSLDYIRTDL